MILNHSNNFLIINKSRFKIYKIVLCGTNDDDGSEIFEVIQDSTGYNVSTLTHQGLVYERQQAFDVKYVSIYPWNYIDNNLSRECKFSTISTYSYDAKTEQTIAKSQVMKILNFNVNLRDTIDVYIRQLFVQPNQSDINSSIILGIEISDKADFNTIFIP